MCKTRVARGNRFIDMSGTQVGLNKIKRCLGADNKSGSQIKWLTVCTGCMRELIVLGGNMRYNSTTTKEEYACRKCNRKHGLTYYDKIKIYKEYTVDNEPITHLMGKYDLGAVHQIDFFPNTFHIESVSFLTLR